MTRRFFNDPFFDANDIFGEDPFSDEEDDIFGIDDFCDSFWGYMPEEDSESSEEGDEDGDWNY